MKLFAEITELLIIRRSETNEGAKLSVLEVRNNGGQLTSSILHYYTIWSIWFRLLSVTIFEVKLIITGHS